MTTRVPDLAPDPLLRVGWSERVEALLAPSVAAGLTPARVVGVDRGGCRLVTRTGETYLPAPGMVVGDWLALDGAGAHFPAPRWSSLGRLDPGGGRHDLAANVDLVMIAAPADRLSLARVERELVVAWDSGASPLIVLTKADLAAPALSEEMSARLGGVEVIATSAATGSGLDLVRRHLAAPTTAVLLGPSGAGKSTLVNALLGEARLEVAGVRAGDSRGRHTTTSRHLVPLPTGGSLIDMPGLRSLGTDASDAAVAAAFADIHELAGGCRFADCAHDVEPGCAVVGAAEDGTLPRARLASYRKLKAEVAAERLRTPPPAPEAEAPVAKVRTKEERRMYRERERER